MQNVAAHSRLGHREYLANRRARGACLSVESYRIDEHGDVYAGPGCVCWGWRDALDAARDLRAELGLGRKRSNGDVGVEVVR